VAPPILKRYLLALNRYKWPGLIGFLGVFGVSAVVALKPPPPPQYEASGSLVQNAPLVAFTATGTEVQQRGQGIITPEFLLADVLLQQVSQELENQGIELEPKQIRDNAIVEVEGEDGEARRVEVSFIWGNAEIAETTLSLLFEGMVELSRVTNRARLRAIIEALNERLPEIEAELRRAEQALEAYDRIEGPAIQAAVDGSLLGAISGSQQQRRQNVITLAGIEAQMLSLMQRLGMTPDEAYASSALSADPIIANLRAQIHQAETELQLLSATLKPSHPRVVELRQSLQGYNNLLNQRAQEVIRGGGQAAALPASNQIRATSNLDPARAALANQLVALSTERDTLLQQQEVLKQSEEQLRQQYASLPNKQLERQRLAQQVALKQALYDQIQAKRIDAQAAEAETVSSLSIAEPPQATLQEQELNNPMAILAIGGVLGIVVGGAIVFLLDVLDSTIRTVEDLQGILRDREIPVLGMIPAIKLRSPRQAPFLLQPDSPYGEAYERLRSNLRLVSDEAGSSPKMMLIASAQDKEGKTVTAFNLGIASARAGRRTLIVEADLRNASAAYHLGVTPDAQANAEPLRYYGGQVGECIRMVPQVENLYISPSPGPQRHSAAIIESSEMQRFLEDAYGRFDMVILDAPALSHSNDAMLLEVQTDGMVLVTRPGKTEKAILSTALDQLEETEDFNLLGAVINDAPVSVSAATNVEPVTADTVAEDLMIDRDLEEAPTVSRVDF